MAVLNTLSVLYCCVLICVAQVFPKEAYLSVPELIASAGYPVEKHRVITSDGYILQLHRLPAGRRTARRSNTPSAKGKRAVLLGHGLMGSSDNFIMMGPERSLGYLLADAGYDVWLANLRGNQYTSHKILSKDDPRFWEFSFDEHGKYDLPATIDHVLNTTGLSKILYIGHSMGTTTFFTMISQKPEYNDKLVAFLALAPAVYLNNIKGLITTIFKTMDLANTARNQGLLSCSVERSLLRTMVTNFCVGRDASNNLCSRLLYTVVGEDIEQYDLDIMPMVIIRAQPASWRQLEHFGKISLTGIFTSWGDGIDGEIKPYNLSNIKIPVLLFYGENDQLTEKTQIKRLARELKELGVQVDVKPACSWPKFNHLDFVFAKDVGTMLNKPLVGTVNFLYKKYGTK